MSSLSKEALELVADWAEVLTVVLALASAVCGIVLVMANKPLKRMAEHETQEERQKTAKAQEEAAKAQLSLKQYLDDVSQRVRPRRLNRAWEGYLKGKPTGSVEIWYQPEDQEAYMLANTIFHSLTGFGWRASEPVPIPKGRMETPGVSPNAPAAIRYGSIGFGNIVLRTWPRPSRPDSAIVIGEKTPDAALRDAMMFGIDGFTGGAAVPDPTLPKDHFIFIVLHE